MQFNDDYFSFAGIHSRRYDYRIVTLEDGGFESKFGRDISITEEKGVNGNNIYYGEENNDVEVEIIICKANEYGTPISFSRSELEFLSKWLFKKGYDEFECGGYIYNAKFINGTMWRSNLINNKGYLKLTLKISGGICYKKVKEQKVAIKKEGYVYCFDDSTATEHIYPYYEFTIKSGATLKITNEQTKQVVEFKDLQANEVIRVDNEIKDMQSSVGINRNIYGKCSNKEFLKLVNGRNDLKIECEDCEFTIKHQSKMCLV